MLEDLNESGRLSYNIRNVLYMLKTASSEDEEQKPTVRNEHRLIPNLRNLFAPSLCETFTMS
jgi:hypothetical protein